jgi:ABC-type protease/lipase transport system fused ATPase/permease subunit
MQVYNRVMLSENVATLVPPTLILAAALLTMSALDAVRSQALIRCGIRLGARLSGRVFEALVVRSAKQGFSESAEQFRQLDNFRTFTTGPGIHFAFDLPWIPIYLLLLFLIHPILGAVATIFAASIIMGRGLAPVERAVATWKQLNDARQGYREVSKLLAEVPPSARHTVVPKNQNSLVAEELGSSIPSRRAPILWDDATDEFRTAMERVREACLDIVDACTYAPVDSAGIGMRRLVDELCEGRLDFTDIVVRDFCRANGVHLMTDDADYRGSGLTLISADRRLVNAS